MDAEDFIIECKKSPIFKKKNIDIKAEYLAGYEFVKESYQLGDMSIFYGIINSPTIHPIELPELKEFHKNSLRHQEIIKHPKKQKDIVEGRKIIGMPNLLSGFKIDKEIDISIINGVKEGTDPKKYELCSTELFARSSEFNKWIGFMHDEKHDYKIQEKIKKVVYEILVKFGLSESYYSAMEELLLFNRIIPADPGLYTIYRAHPFIAGKYEKFMRLDGDTAPTKIAEMAKRDKKEYGSLDKKVLIGRPRRDERSKIRKTVLELYAQYEKRVGANHIVDKIKQDMRQEKIKITTSAIQKIIDRS